MASARHRSGVLARLPGPVLAALVVVGCGSGEAGRGSLLSRDEVAVRLDQAIAATQWPPAIRPTSAALTKNLGAKELFESGYEMTLVQGANACAWYVAWVDARAAGDAAGTENALRAMEEVIPTYGFASGGPSTVQFFKDIPAKARLGDPSGVNSFITANGCRTTLAEP